MSNEQTLPQICKVDQLQLSPRATLRNQREQLSRTALDFNTNTDFFKTQRSSIDQN